MKSVSVATWRNIFDKY